MRREPVGRVVLGVALACALGVLAGTPASARPVEPFGGAPAFATGETPTSPWHHPHLNARNVPPHVRATAPLGDRVPVDAAIVITFSQPMSRSSVEESLSVRPQVYGSLTWPDDFTLRFLPLRLAHASTYEVDVAGESVQGSPLTGPQSWRFSTVPGPPITLPPGPGAIRVPVLMYHYIRVNPVAWDRLGYNLSVTPSDFAAQMQWLADNGFHTITFRDLHAYLAGDSGLPSRPIILTFDDGYEDFYTAALPVLIKHDFTAVAYVVSGFVGWPGYMTAAQIQAADRAGIEIGSHTVDHVDLTRLSADGVRHQLSASKQTLEQMLGHEVLSFCYPSGKFNWSVAAAVQAAGYRDATTTQAGSVRTLSGRYMWPRLRVSGGELLGYFAADVTRSS